MARKDAGFVDQHIEKVVVGLCAVALVGAAVMSFGGGRFSIDERGPAELVKAVGEAADQTKNAILNARPPEPKPAAANDAVAPINRWFGKEREGLLKIASLEEVPARSQHFPPPLASNKDLSAEKRNLVQLVAPGVPIVMAGRSKFSLSQPRPAFGESEPPADAVVVERSTSWVAVGGQVDLTAQEANFIAERYPDLSYPIVVKILLQRRESGDPSAVWEDVEPFLPFETMPRPSLEVLPDGKIKMGRLDTWRLQLEALSEDIARPRLPRRLTGDKLDFLPLPYLDEPPKSDGAGGDAAKRAVKWLRLARAAFEGKKPFDSVDVDSALVLAQAVAGSQGIKETDRAAAAALLKDIRAKLPKDRRGEVAANPPAPERMMPLVAYDFNAQPGHKYVYRLRYEILNVYAGNRSELFNPRDAERLTIFSAWSPASRPVIVQSDLYFYLSKADRAKKEATVTVLRVSKQNDVIRQDYKVTPGEKIGKEEKRGQKADFRTGAVCLEVDFDRTNGTKRDVALIYSDGGDGSVHERLLSKDSADKFFKSLLEKKTARR